MVIIYNNPYGPGVDCYEHRMNVQRIFFYCLGKYLLFKNFGDSTYKNIFHGSPCFDWIWKTEQVVLWAVAGFV
jgi:hypothetical protein